MSDDDRTALLARLAALEREVARLRGELDAAEQHVTILRNEVARLSYALLNVDQVRTAALEAVVGVTDCAKCGTSKTQCDEWKSGGHVCCPDCKHPPR